MKPVPSSILRPAAARRLRSPRVSSSSRRDPAPHRAHCRRGSPYVVFGAAYLAVGWNVVAAAFRGVVRGRFLDENFLMTVATGGAFAIGLPTEAVGVMLFYKVGEIMQGLSVARSRRSIRALLDLRPDTARVRRRTGT